MNKLITLFLFVCGITSYAQPTLLSTEMAAPGTTFNYKHVGTFTPIDTAQQGANQTWNFSTVSTTADPDYINTIINPANTSFADSFPNANWGILEDGTDYYFFHRTSSLMERVGSYNTTDGYTYYSDTQIEYLFPLALGVSSFDNSVSENNGSSSSATYAFDCIGYGTLLVPGHTYTNVLMTRAVIDIGFLQVESFIWYDSNNGMPVFDYLPGDGFFIPESAIYLNNVTTSIKENTFASGMQLNNPVSSNLTMKLYSENPVALSYDVKNTLGATIYTGEIEKNNIQELTISMEALPAGIYIFTVVDQSNRSLSRSMKFTKQ